MIKYLILKKCFADFLEAWQLKEKGDIPEATKFEMFANYVILSQDDLDTFVGHPELLEFFLIQSKERTDFDSSAVNTFGIGVKNFFSEPLFPENDKIKTIRELKDYIFSEEKVYRKLSENRSVRIFYVFCGATPNDEHTKAVKELLIRGLKSCPDCLGAISMDIIDGKSIME